MNIITVTYGNTFYYIRPDVTLNRDCTDFYCHPEITSVSAAPFLYTRIERAGKAVAAKFAERYFGKIGYGVNVTGISIIDKNEPCSYLAANAMDSSTYYTGLYEWASFPLVEIYAEAERWCDKISGTYGDMLLWKETFSRKIEKITRYTPIRTGDFIALELCPAVTFPPGEKVRFHEISFKIV